MSDLRDRLEGLGERMPPAPDAWERLERARRRHERRRRTTAGLLAVVVAVAGTFVAVSALSPHAPSGVGGGESPGFLSLWPQRSVELGSGFLADAEAAQRRTDEGDPSASWQLSPEEVASRFAEQVLGWSRVVVDSTTKNVDGSLTVTIGMKGICQQAPPESSVVPGGSVAVACGPLIVLAHEVTLAQPVVSGTGGIWEVIEVHPANASEFDLGVTRGQSLSAGQALRFEFGDLPPGAVGLVASLDCTAPVDVLGTVTVDPNFSFGTVEVPHDLNAAGECVAPPSGYLYAYSLIPPGSQASGVGDPFHASDVIGEIAIVPVALSRTASPGPPPSDASSTPTVAPVAVVGLHLVSTNDPSAELSFGGSTEPAVTGSYSWGDTIRDMYLPLPFHPLVLPSGTIVKLEGHADALEAAIHDRASLASIVLLQVREGELRLDVEPGRYFLGISASYSGDTVPFYFAIDVRPLDSSATPPDP